MDALVYLHIQYVCVNVLVCNRYIFADSITRLVWVIEGPHWVSKSALPHFNDVILFASRIVIPTRDQDKKVLPQNNKSKVFSFRKESVKTTDQETRARPDLKKKKCEIKFAIPKRRLSTDVWLSPVIWWKWRQRRTSSLMSRGIWIQFCCLSPRHFHVAYMFSKLATALVFSCHVNAKISHPTFAYFNKSCSRFCLPPHPHVYHAMPLSRLGWLNLYLIRGLARLPLGNPTLCFFSNVVRLCTPAQTVLGLVLDPIFPLVW